MIAFGPAALDQLDEIVGEYIAANDLCAKQRQHLRRHVRKFHQWRSRQIEPPAGNAILNHWLAELAETLAPATVNGYRQSILSLVRFATPDDEPLPRADRIRRQKEPEKIKPAFRLAEIRKMIHRAATYQPMTQRTFGQGRAGDIVPRPMWDRHLRWAIWWEAFLRVAYDSGQYLTDLQQLTWPMLRRDGSATIVRHKTGRLITFRLRPETIRAARKIGDDELVIPWRWNLGMTWDREFKRFIQHAGVRQLGAKSLRRSAITYTYIDQGPEAARMLAGHASFATTARHYIDWSIARRPAIQPPPL